MTWPISTDYSDAMEHYRSHLEDPVLKLCNIRRSKKDGSVVGTNGAFAIVYRFEQSSGKNFAVRCFIKEVKDQEQRYRQLKQYLEPRLARLPMLVDFVFLPSAISVDAGGNTKKYPILRMDWADGKQLHRYIEETIKAQKIDLLGQLARQWCAVLIALEAEHIGHGDLQHGNIKVDDNGKIWLIDYDGMFVPALRGNPPGEKGHRHYQHPLRRAADYGANIDSFSALVIYTSLLALEADYSLQKAYPADDYLLFQEVDFKKPGQTSIWQRLANSSSEDVRKLTERLQEFCTQQVATLPPLSQVVRDLANTPAARMNSAASAPSPAAAPPPPAARPVNTPSTSLPTTAPHSAPLPSRRLATVQRRHARTLRPRRAWRTLVIGAAGLVLLLGALRGFNLGPAAGQPPTKVTAIPGRPSQAFGQAEQAPTALATDAPLPTAFGKLTAIRVAHNADGNDRFELCEIQLASSGETPSARCELRLPTGARDTSWSRDGQRLLFSAPLNNQATRLQIFVLDVSAGQAAAPQPLTGANEDARRPVWLRDQPDQFIFEAQNEKGTYEIHGMQPDGSQRRTLVSTSATSIWPDSSSDGKTLLFTNDSQHGYQVYRVASGALPADGLHTISSATLVSQQGNQTTCRNGAFSANNSIAYVCESPTGSYLVDGGLRINIPQGVQPRGHLTWLPNNSGYVFECAANVAGSERSQLCLADQHTNTVTSLALDISYDYYAPALRPTQRQ